MAANDVPQEDSGALQQFGGDDEDEIANNQDLGENDNAPGRGDDDAGGDYASVHGPTLEALDAKLTAVGQAHQSLAAQQQVLAAQREKLRQQNKLDSAAAALATQKHAVLAQANQGALQPSSGLPPGQVPQAGAMPSPGAPGAPGAPLSNIHPAVAGLDVDQHLKDMNYTDQHWADANNELKQQTGKTASEMYDALQQRGLMLPQDAKLTDRQKGELFLKFGMGLLQQQHAGLVRPDQWQAPNAGADIAKAAGGALQDYDQILAGQRQGALEQWKENQATGLAAANHQADLEKALAEKKAAMEQAGMIESGRNARTDENVQARLQIAGENNATRRQGYKTRAQTTDTGTWQAPQPGPDGNQIEHNSKTGEVRIVKGPDGKPLPNVKDTGKEIDAAKAAAANTKATDAETRAAEAKADKALSNYGDMTTYKTDPKTGKPTGERFTRDELVNQYLSQAPAHARAAAAGNSAATSTSAAPKPPAKGDVVNGYKFLGGDPSAQTSWQKG